MEAADPLAGWRLRDEPYYETVGDELVPRGRARGPAAGAAQGADWLRQTRFVEHGLARWPAAGHRDRHEDLGGGDLAGRWLLDGEGTRWMDGHAGRRHGARATWTNCGGACRHHGAAAPAGRHAPVLPLERRGELLQAHPDFQLVISYNPGYQGLHKRLKPSTRQRFVALAFDYPDEAREAQIVAREGSVDADMALRLVRLARRTRQLVDEGLDEGASTRMLVHAAQLVGAGRSRWPPPARRSPNP
jgi:nitric oxide reductase NorQ protein